MDHWQYLMVLGACLAITLPLEFFGSGVYRQIGRTASALLPVAAVFVTWDVLAISGQVWTYNPDYVTGIRIGSLPLEELLFFLVIPLCGLLTYNAVTSCLGLFRRLRDRSSESA
ncbi:MULTISPECIES: lycopene cyclase domain-containing protein [unclassified Mycobacterium]|jgi:lycopene cyclase domain-containing protein|uniref:lycopene cyclase domain-containing protein n=1 Tax=unclassified Mycobacterium TaxID=2642494 RepID=UPI003424112A